MRLARAMLPVVLSLIASPALAQEASAPWWQRGADEWYYKDDWRAQAISPTQGGPNRPAMVQTLEVPSGAVGGWILVWGDRSYGLSVAGQRVGEGYDGGLIGDYDLSSFLAGQTQVTLALSGEKVAAEGELVGADGTRYPFATDAAWRQADGGAVRAEPMATGPSGGAYNRSHNGRLLTYTPEQRGQAAIAKGLARLQKLQEQGLYLLRRYRPAQEILSFDEALPWRQAEGYAAPLMEQAQALLREEAIAAQQAGRYDEAQRLAGQAGVLLAAAEAAVGTATELYQGRRELAHLRNVAHLLGRPDLEQDLGELETLLASAQAAYGLEDFASAGKALERLDDLALGLRGRLEASAAEAGTPLVGGVGHLDAYPEDPFGWFNAKDLMANDPHGWPFHVGPADRAYVALDGLWEFRTDADNVGVEQGFATGAGEGWRMLQAPLEWERQGITEDNRKAPNAPIGRGTTNRDKPYNGFAWYRKSVVIPAEWRGRDLVLSVGNVQNWCQVYINGRPVDAVQGEQEQRRLIPATRVDVPQDAVKFGQENLIAIHVYNHDNFGGIVGGPLALHARDDAPRAIETSLPMGYAYEQTWPGADGGTRVTFLAGAMSPGVLVASDGGTLDFSGWQAKGHALPQRVYVRTADGVRAMAPDALPAEPLAAQWIRLEGEGTNALIVPAAPAVRLRWGPTRQGAVGLSVEFAEGPARAAVLNLPADARLDDGAWDTWAAQLRQYPVAASEVVLAAGPGGNLAPRDAGLQSCRIRYNYLPLGGAEGTAVAPVPMLVSYGLRYEYPGLRVPEATTTPYAGPYGAPYRFVESGDVLSYEAPAIDRSRMMKGVGELFARKRVEDNVHGGLGEVEMYQRMAEWGFDHCRYALAFNADWDLPMVPRRTGPITEDEAIWRRLDEIVRNCNDAGMQMMLCWFPEIESRGWKDNPDWQATSYEWWRRVAARYADLPEWAISYDFYNEPAYMNTDHWNQVMKELTAIIRAEDPVHMIVWESADGWAQCHWCLWMEPVDDPHVMYSFHHYGKHWGYAYDEYYPGYQSTFERTQVDPWLEAILFGIQHHAFIHCGEFGISMLQPGDDGEAWLNDYLAMFERFGIGWNWWNYSGDNIYRTGLATNNRVSPYVPILIKWMDRSGWGKARQETGAFPSLRADR